MKYIKFLLPVLFASCVFVKMATFKEPKTEYFTYYKKGNKISAISAKPKGIYFYQEFDKTLEREAYGFYYLTDTGYMGLENLADETKDAALARAKRYMLNPPDFYKHTQWYGYYILENNSDFKATYVTILKDAGSKVDFYTEGHLSGDTLWINKEIAYYRNDTLTTLLNRKCVFETL